MVTAQSNPPASIDSLATAGVFDAVSDAQWAVGFEAGYRRAVNNIVADLALIAAEVGRELGADNAEVRHALRQLRARFEEHLEGESTADHRPAPSSGGYVDGGLGI